jgi:simple sugar transport system permease protein
MAALSGLLKAIWKTNELITSYLISSCMINLGNYLVTGPVHDPQTNLLSTRQIAASMQLHQILPPSGLSTALIYAVCLTFIVNAYLFKTKGGYELRMVGINEDFARYGGIGSHGRIVWALFLSGFFHGLAGGMLVLGTYHATLREFSSGIGWSSFSVALIASGNPIAVLPASFFFAWIQSGATIAMQQSDVTSDLAQIAQGLVFLLISSTVLLKGRKNTWN